MIKKIKTSDVCVGMYVDRVDSEWLTSPWVMSRFKITSERVLRRLEEYDIKHVFIDTSKGVDIGEGMKSVPYEEGAGVSIEDTFPVELKEFWTSHHIPVDIYRLADNRLSLILKKDLTYSEEAEELFRSRGVTTVYVPKAQKEIFDKHKASLETIREDQRKKGFTGLFADPVKVSVYLKVKNAYHAIDPFVLEPGSRPDFDIFIRREFDVVPASRKGSTLDEQKVDGWISQPRQIVIRNEDRKAYQNYLLSRSSRKNDKKAQAAIVRENSRILVADLAKDPKSKTLMRHTKKTVVDISDVVLENPTTFYGLIKIRDYDYDTYTHSVNVAAMSVALAIENGMRDKKELESLGLGAILHDIGKSRVSRSIINKPGKLTPDEYGKAKLHVMLGYEIVRAIAAVPEIAIIPILQHHEKLSGNGYPNGLADGQIHQFGRVSALIDIYDALTTKRPYEKSMRPYDALALISKGIEDYDKSLYYLFVNLIHKQRV